MFHRAIGQSGSALAGWAFDKEPEYHARRIARKLDCDKADQEDLIQCLKDIPAINLTMAHKEYVVGLLIRIAIVLFHFLLVDLLITISTFRKKNVQGGQWDLVELYPVLKQRGLSTKLSILKVSILRIFCVWAIMIICQY